MMAKDWDLPIAHVLRSSTVGFSAGTRVGRLEGPAFGRVVRVSPTEESHEVIYGLLYDIHVDDDPLVRQVILAEAVSAETIQDQRKHRIVPLEMSILAIAYRTNDGWVRHALPPRPPLSLDPVYLCTPEETQEVASSFGYFQMVLGAGQVPGEQLLASTLLEVAQTYPEDEQYDFLVRAGREAAKLMSNDPARLDYLLRLIYPS